MNFLVIVIAKISYLFLKIKHNGSVYPGGLALKMNKNILKYFKLPKVIFVTGTTGKGSVVSNLKKYIQIVVTVLHVIIKVLI